MHFLPSTQVFMAKISLFGLPELQQEFSIMPQDHCFGIDNNSFKQLSILHTRGPDYSIPCKIPPNPLFKEGNNVWAIRWNKS
jgi:hypothetical protein